MLGLMVTLLSRHTTASGYHFCRGQETFEEEQKRIASHTTASGNHFCRALAVPVLTVVGSGSQYRKRLSLLQEKLHAKVWKNSFRHNTASGYHFRRNIGYNYFSYDFLKKSQYRKRFSSKEKFPYILIINRFANGDKWQHIN